MNNLITRAHELQQSAHELIYLGIDGKPIYAEEFSRLNKEVLVKSESLFTLQSSDVEEEAHLCLALLMGYNATIYDYGDKEQKKQIILDRIYSLLDKLPASLLKVRLLSYCYSEVCDEDLAQEAHAIVKSWHPSTLTAEQAEAIAELQNFEENQYPFEVLED